MEWGRIKTCWKLPEMGTSLPWRRSSFQKRKGVARLQGKYKVEFRICQLKTVYLWFPEAYVVNISKLFSSNENLHDRAMLLVSSELIRKNTGLELSSLASR